MPDDPADLLDLLAARAPALRKAGVLTVTIGDLQATLAPFQEPAIAVEKRDESAPPTDPLLDPHTYGFGAGDKIPGLTHLEINPSVPYSDEKANGKR